MTHKAMEAAKAKPYIAPETHLATAMKVIAGLLKDSRDEDGGRGPHTSALQEVHDHIEAVGEYLASREVDRHPEWEGHSADDIPLLLRDLKEAAALLRGEYLLYAHLCWPGEDGKCVSNHELVATDLAAFKADCERNLAPVLYAVPRDFAVSHTVEEVDAYLDDNHNDFFWLGDIDRAGGVICGLLLHYLVCGPSVPFYTPKTAEEKEAEDVGNTVTA